MPEAIILDLFWVVHHKLLPQMRSNWYKMFINDSTQDNASHGFFFVLFFCFFLFCFMAFNTVWRILRNIAKKLILWLIRFRFFYVLWLRPQLFPKLKILWKYITVMNFISITLAVANLKILKVLHSDSVSMKWPFLVRVGGVWGWVGFETYSPLQIWLHFADAFIIGTTQSDKKVFEKSFEN